MGKPKVSEEEAVDGLLKRLGKFLKVSGAFLLSSSASIMASMKRSIVCFDSVSVGSIMTASLTTSGK